MTAQHIGRVLYVFRDGTALSIVHDMDWPREAASARVVTDEAGRYVDANAEAAQLFGVEVEEIIGQAAGTFTKPDIRVGGEAVWRALRNTGRLHSLSIVRCPDGSERSIEFVTIRDGDGPERHVTVMRAIK